MPLARGAQRVQGARLAALLGAGALLLGLAALAADDARLRQAAPRDSAYARAYIQAMVRDDPAGMWDAYSAQARLARGGNRAAYLAAMRDGLPPHQGPTNRFRLAAAVPLEGGLTLYYYQVDVATSAGPDHLLIPVVIDGSGRVEEAGSDGLSFVPPSMAAVARP